MEKIRGDPARQDRDIIYANSLQINMPPSSIILRPAIEADLDTINRVVEAGVMTWQLPERVKRLALPGYRYTLVDIEHLDICVAEDDTRRIIGVAAWETADSSDTPTGKTGLLLHGIYVNPAFHRHGIGRRLFKAAEEAVRAHGYDGLLTRARQEANDFFMAQEMNPLPVDRPSHQYANRFWKHVKPTPASG